MTSLITNTLKVALGADHAGFAYKEIVKQHLNKKGFATKDFGTFSEVSCNYPDFVKPAAEAVSDNLCDIGIVFGGSGNGEAMAANKVPRVRCALCWSVETARLAKKHNNANMIAIGQRMISESLTLEILEAWISEDFEGGRHIARIAMLDK